MHRNGEEEEEPWRIKLINMPVICIKLIKLEISDLNPFQNLFSEELMELCWDNYPSLLASIILFYFFYLLL